MEERVEKVKEGYKKTELGWIPEEWEAIILSNISSKIGDGLHGTPEYNINGEYHFINGNNLVKGRVVIIQETKRVSEVEYLKNKKELNNNTLLISLNGTIGNIAYYNNEKVMLGKSSGYIVLNDNINKQYIYYVLNNTKTMEYFLKELTGTTIKNLSLNTLRKTPISLPLLKEQQKIAQVLSTVDSQIDDTDKLIEKTKELKKGLMQRLLSKGIGHKEFKKTEVGEIPVEWEVIDFFEFVDKIIDFRGRTPKKLGLEWGDGNILALSANNVRMGKIDFQSENYFASDELYEKWMLGNELEKNDLLMTMEAPLGNVALVPDENKYILSQRVVALKTKEYINNRFMLYMIMSDIVQRQLDALSTGTTAKGINQKNLAKVKVIIPSLKEQQKIAQIISSVDSQIEEYQNKKTKLEELKKGLMQQLLTGGIRVI